MRPDYVRIWRTIFFGQFLSLLLCGTGIASQLLDRNYSLKTPTAQSFLNYVILCLIFTTWLAFKPGDSNLFTVMRLRGWKYFILAAMDVEANFLVVKAYQYTTLTSIQLLDCFTIPTVLLLSWLWIKVQYGIVHILGVCLSLIGIGCLIYSDLDESTKGQEAKNRFLGDMLCIMGATLYGISNVTQEYVVKSYSIVEFLGMIGLFGSIIGGVQLAIFELKEVKALFHLDKYIQISLILSYAACLLLFYITMPLVLQVSNATSVNISMLSADFYSLLIGLYLFDYKFNWLYFISFALIIMGVTTFNLIPAPSKIDPVPNLNNTEVNSRTALSPAKGGGSSSKYGDDTVDASTDKPMGFHRLDPTSISMTSGQIDNRTDVILPNVLEFAQNPSQSIYSAFPPHHLPHSSSASHLPYNQQVFQAESDLIASTTEKHDQFRFEGSGISYGYHQHQQQLQRQQQQQQQDHNNYHGTLPQRIWEDQC
ncbi:solute carrier family 35 member F2 [Tetranychus urticae]|uniref:EamA domain-containing protein n=1 Tax=Tetranychus urticae TaxID=32264 RepID=T1KFG2_TETUR|nr:solute carrier family 35 member F2 [Tetranychus urticae]XP_015786443.1 solute carrier family 35 member F2 [Tetranychus urticae]